MKALCTGYESKSCNYRNKNSCSMVQEYLTYNIIYQTTVMTKDEPNMPYIGISEGLWG